MRTGCAIDNSAIDSYADRDAVLAGALGELDDRLDELHNDYIDTVFSSRFDRYITTQQAVQLAVIGRFYERIGDHAVNIGERSSTWLPENYLSTRRPTRPDST